MNKLKNRFLVFGIVLLFTLLYTVNAELTPDFSTIDSTIQTFLDDPSVLYLVVGDQAPKHDVVGAVDIATAFTYYSGETVQTKLVSEISDPYNTNLISVGRPHYNEITNFYLPSSIWPLEENTAIITQLIHGDTATLVIAGNTDVDTRDASRVIADFNDYNLNGTCFKVDTTDPESLVLSECGDLSPINDAPEIIAVYSIPETITAGDTVQFGVDVYDPDNDELTFKWYVDGVEAESYTLLIEEDIGDYEFMRSDERIDEGAKMYSAIYLKYDDIEEHSVMAMYYDFSNYDNIEELLEEIEGEYEEVEYNDNILYLFEDEHEGKFLFWIYEGDLILIFSSYEDELPNEVIDAYLEKYPSDIAEPVEGEGEETEEEPEVEPLGSNTFTYYADETGEHEIKVIVSDGELEVDHTWNINVEESIRNQMKAEVEGALDSLLSVFESVNNANICVVIKEDEDYRTHSFDITIENGVKQVSLSKTYCDGAENEDFIFNFVDYQSFLEQKQEMTLNSLIENSDGSRFYFLPSKFIEDGFSLIMDNEFKTRYCSVIRENTNKLIMGLYGLSDCRSLPKADSFDGSTTNFSVINDLNQADNVVLEKTSHGKIDFGSSNLDLSDNVDFDSYVAITDGIVAVDTNTLPSLNVPATVTMYGLTYTTKPVIYYNAEFTINPADFTTVCPANICSNVDYDPSTGMLTFDVAHFSSYGTGPNNAPVADADSATIVEDSVNHQIDVLANDYDVDLDALTIIDEGTASNGTTSTDGSFVYYTPNSGYKGADSFDYTISDGNGGTDTATVIITVQEAPPPVPENNLIIYDLDVEVGSKTDKNLNDGDKIDEEARPGDKVAFEIEIKNTFDYDMDIEDIEVEVTIEGIDDDDLEESEDIGRIRGGDKDDVKIEFEIPENVEEDTYDVIIRIEGDDEDNNEHVIEWTLQLEVKKENHKLSLYEADLSPSAIGCLRTVYLDIGIRNIGDNDEDVDLTITSNELDIDETKSFELSDDIDDSDNEYEKTFTFNIGEDVTAGSYPIYIEAEYDDNDEVEMETVYLTVEDCGAAPSDDVGEETGEVEFVLLPGQGDSAVIDTTTQTPSLTVSFIDSKGYVISLAVIVMILLIVLIFLIGTAVTVSKR